MLIYWQGRTRSCLAPHAVHNPCHVTKSHLKVLLLNLPNWSSNALEDWFTSLLAFASASPGFFEMYNCPEVWGLLIIMFASSDYVAALLYHLQSLGQNVVANSKAQHKSRHQKDTHNIWKFNLTLFYKWTATNHSFNYGQYMYITRDWCTHSKPCKQQLTTGVIWQAVNLHLKDNFIIFSFCLGNYV